LEIGAIMNSETYWTYAAGKNVSLIRVGQSVTLLVSRKHKKFKSLDDVLIRIGNWVSKNNIDYVCLKVKWNEEKKINEIVDCLSGERLTRIIKLKKL
jgi:hypothetical protein